MKVRLIPLWEISRDMPWATAGRPAGSGPRADLAAQHRVLVPGREEFGILGHLAPGEHYHAAEQAA